MSTIYGDVADRGGESGGAPRVAPCPFCGFTSLSTQEGSTFRWVHVQCDECGAQGPEVRVQTLGDGTREEWVDQGCKDAIAAWNTRAARLGADTEGAK